MTQDQSLFPQPQASGQWEEALRQWERNFSPQTLGLKLALMMQRLMPPACLPLLEDIASAFRQHDDALRWQIFQQAKETGFSTPAGALGLSLFWSYGSMSPQGLEPVYPDPTLSPTLLHCAIVMLVMHLSEDPTEGVSQLLAHYAAMERM